MMISRLSSTSVRRFLINVPTADLPTSFSVLIVSRRRAYGLDTSLIILQGNCFLKIFIAAVRPPFHDDLLPLIY